MKTPIGIGRERAKKALDVDVCLDMLLDPEEHIFPREWLDRGVLKEMSWDSPASGRRIPDKVAEQLEKEWRQFLKQIRKPIREANLQCSRANAREEVLLPEEAGIEQAFVEGAKKQITVDAYERSDKARQKCIAHYGLNCAVCGFNFEKVYGEIGKGYIQVHHIVPLSSVKKGYKVNPAKDLRPVCPNCHAMLHRRDPPYTIKELKAILKKQRARSRRP